VSSFLGEDYVAATPLYRAAGSDVDITVMEMLLKAGANHNVGRDPSSSPLEGWPSKCDFWTLGYLNSCVCV
jgi:hypothetical protein